MNITRSSRRTIAGKRPPVATSWILLPLGAALLASCSQPSGNEAPAPVSNAAPSKPAATAPKPAAMAATPLSATGAKPVAGSIKVPVAGPVTASVHKMTGAPVQEPLLAPTSRYLTADEKSSGWRWASALANYTPTGQRLIISLEPLLGAKPLTQYTWRVDSPVVEKWPGGKTTEVKVSGFTSQPQGTNGAIVIVEVAAPLGSKHQSVTFDVPIIGDGNSKVIAEVNSVN